MASQQETSVAWLEKKIEKNPRSLAFSRLADTCRKNGDIQRAIDICQEGLAVHPEYSTGRLILGRCFLEQENFDAAIQEFTRVCTSDRRNQVAIKMLADVFSKQGREEKAGDLYNLLLKMDPENASLVHLSNVFKGSGKKDLFDILDIERNGESPGADISFGETAEQPALGGEISSEDVGERMDAMFGEAKSAGSDFSATDSKSDIDALPDAPELEAQDDSPLSAASAFERGAAIDDEADQSEAEQQGIPSVHGAGDLTGGDISNRLDEMFGKEGEAGDDAADVDLTDILATESVSEEADGTESAVDKSANAGPSDAESEKEVLESVDEISVGSEIDSEDVDQREGAGADQSADPRSNVDAAGTISDSVFIDDRSDDIADYAGVDDGEFDAGETIELDREMLRDVVKTEGIDADTESETLSLDSEEQCAAEAVEHSDEPAFINEDTPGVSEEAFIIDGEQSPAADDDSLFVDEGAVTDSAIEDGGVDGAAKAEPASDEKAAQETIDADTVTGDDIAEQLDEMFATSPEEDSSEAKAIDQVAAGETIELERDDYIDSAGPVAESGNDAVSGDDISDRLESMFNDGPAQQVGGEQAEDDDHDVGALNEQRTRPDAQDTREGFSLDEQDNSDLVEAGEEISVRQEEHGDVIEDSDADKEDEAAGETNDETNDENIADAISAGDTIVLNRDFIHGVESGEAGAPSGDDVGARIDQLFNGDAELSEGEQAQMPSSRHERDELDQYGAEESISAADSEESTSVDLDQDAELSVNESNESTEFDDEIHIQGAKRQDNLPTSTQTGNEADLEDTVTDLKSKSVLESEQEELSGEDIADRLDEIFAIEEDILDSGGIPEDEEPETDGAGGDFYTVSGESAALDNDEGAVLEQLEQENEAIASDEQNPTDSREAETQESREEETLAEIPAQHSPEAEDHDSESPEPEADDVVPETLINELAEPFDSSESPEESIPDDDEEEDSSVDSFYNVTGGAAQDLPEDNEVLETIHALENESTPDQQEPRESEAEPEAVPHNRQMAEDGETGGREATSMQENQSDSEQDSTRFPNIPDHVLTPTLADIYYQQGQPHLAIHIYKRLLAKDDENEKLQRRLQLIEQTVADEAQRTNQESAPAAKPQKAESTDSSYTSQNKNSSSDGDGRPLKGKRIKKKVRERILQKKKNSRK